MKIYVAYDETGRAYYFKGIVGKMLGYMIGLRHKTFLDEYKQGSYYSIKDFRGNQ